MEKKSWKYYAKWIKDKVPYFNLNYDLTSTDKELRKRAKKAKKFKKKWGFRYEQTWCLDQEIAKFVLPRLAYLRDNHMGYPGDLITERDKNGNPLNDNGNKRWTQILNDMCLAFELIIKDEMWDNEKQDIIEKGLKLFAEYYQSLWD